jgi:hypothetical protein
MPSPFPGMDPYLENPAFWPDFHERFITYWCDELAEHLPETYEARIGERVSLLEPASETGKRIGPDVSLTKGRDFSPGRPEAGSVATLEPVNIPFVVLNETKEAYIEILHRPDRELIAVLELLSPSNKEADGFEQYRVKRNAIIHQAVHLVELDLLIGGRRLPLSKALPAGDYYAFVGRSDDRPDCQVYAWTIREPLPTIPIPLKAPDPDVQFNLAAVFATAYKLGRYARSIDYAAPPPVRLADETEQWLTEQVRLNGKSPS